MRASWHIGFGRPLVEFSGRPLARWSAPGFAAACARLMIAWRALFTVVFTITGLAIAGLAVARGQLDFEFVEFVPLGFGALAVGNGQQFLHAAAGGNRLRCVHPHIIPLFQNRCCPAPEDRTRRGARDRETSRLLHKVFDGALDQFVVCLLRTKKPTSAELDELERIIAAARQRKTPSKSKGSES